MAKENQTEPQMSVNPELEKDRALILQARQKGKKSTLWAYVKLSGPGWLQSAITLGGGSLSSSLYLGVLVGFSFMWLQPFAMMLGVIMLCAIAYVTLSTNKRPLREINRHVSPVLGWSWLIASMMANIVWSMPQFSLATAAIRQNLFPNIFGAAVMPDPGGKVVVGLIVLAIALTVVMFYNQGGWGAKVFEILVKIMVGSIVICFFGVVIKLTSEGALDWSKIGSGLIPDLSLLTEPTQSLRQHIAAVDVRYQDFWKHLIVSQQRDVMISAAATAVGINMTFLLPYSMLRKGWDRDFRGLAIFDLSTGLFIPFILATACVVIASASQFHAQPAPGFLGEIDSGGRLVQPAPNLVGPYKSLMTKRLRYEMTPEELAAFESLSAEQRQAMIDAASPADKKMAAMLVKRDAFNLADSLAPLTGNKIARYVFGFGVLGMALNAATMLMLINGLCFCELINKTAKGLPQKIGSLMVAVGILGPFFWKDAKMWLAVPTSVFAMVLLPIAYFTFFLLMNQKSLLGHDVPKGGKRVVWNILMAVAASMAAFGSIWTLWNKLKWLGIGLFTGFIVLSIIVHIIRGKNKIKTV